VRQIIITSSKKIKGDISIYYKNLTTGETVILNGEEKYYMASLYKVIVTLYVLEREKHGELSLQEKVGSPAATLDAALTRVITESNNEYAQAIAHKYGWDNIEQYIKPRFGIDFSFKSDLSSNIKTIGALFEIISEAIKLSDTESHYLLQLLNHQTRLNKLPKYLPKNIYSHNKTGEFEQYSHDAGLFYTPRANYILIFMSKTGSPDATNEQMAIMSRDIYHALND
jgi:beta-lactamase class A